MLKLTAQQKKMFAGVAITGFFAVLFTVSKLHLLLSLYDIHTFLYAGLVIAWGFLVHQRIVNRQVRIHLVTASVFMLILFLSRLVRWRCFRDNAFAQEYAWYAYYVSFVAVPLCAFLAALCVGKKEEEKPLHYARWLWYVWLIITIVVLTNAWHGWFFHFEDGTHKNYSYGPAYYICVALGFLFAIATMIIIIRRCQIATAREYWFIPAAEMAFFTGLIAWYYAVGGSPKIFGRNIFNLQEVFCLLYVVPFESMIQLGILPSNSRYSLFFENSPVLASIQDDAGEVIYASKQVKSQAGAPAGDGAREGKLAGTGEREEMPGAQALRRSEKAIHGGKIVWYEDLAAIHRLDEEIQKVTEELEEENDLIRQENEVRSERISYETKNRLYDKIATAVKDKALAIDAILAELVRSNAGAFGGGNAAGKLSETDRERLIRAMVLGAYVKRMGNMMLITEEAERISTRELASAIRESLEYFGLTGLPCDFQEKGEELLPARLVLLSYELLEELLENSEKTYSLMILLDARERYVLRIMLDARSLPADASWRKEELAAVGASLAVEYLDDTWRVTLREEADLDRTEIINMEADLDRTEAPAAEASNGKEGDP